MDSLVLQTVIGLVFVFAAFAALVSVLTETVARFIGLRGEYLLRGMRTLLDGNDAEFALPWREIIRPTAAAKRETRLASAAAQQAAQLEAAGQPPQPASLVDRVMQSAVVGRFADKANMPEGAGNRPLNNKERRALPSYVSGRAFALGLLDVIAADPADQISVDRLRRAITANVPASDTREVLLQLATHAGNDIEEFRRSVARWYDDHMDRVSGWYKRHVRWISVAFGIVIVLAFNLNALAISKALYTDEALRTAVVSQAAEAADCERGTPPATCFGDLRAAVADAQGAGLPIGYGEVADCASHAPDRPGRDRERPSRCDWGERYGFLDPADDAVLADGRFLGIVLVGWVLMVLALLPGSRFWFDALSRLGSLRSSGPKPPPASPVR